jgi:hypothetical protein
MWNSLMSGRMCELDGVVIMVCEEEKREKEINRIGKQL